jgi:hypothetical protein
MKRLSSVLLVLLVAGCPLAFAKDKSESFSCAVKFSIIQKDSLGNVQQGVKDKALKWIQNDLQKRFPDVCYVSPDQPVTVVFLITVQPATYHGTRVVDTSSTTKGTITDDEDGGSASYQGTTDSSTVVPVQFEYGKFTLSVQTMTSDKRVQVKHRFEQDGIYRTLYGIPLGGRGHHPQQALIEDAVKWIHAGGLQDPFQSTQ